ERSIVVILLRHIVVETDALHCSRCPVQRKPERCVGIIHGLAAAAETQNPFMEFATGITDQFVLWLRGITAVLRTPQGQTQRGTGYRTLQGKVVGGIGTKGLVLLQAVTGRERA